MKTMIKLSVSKIKLFKACRRAYELKYIEGLVPVQKADALETGTNYHERIESLYKGQISASEGDYSKEAAMAEAYRKYIYPKVKIVETEKWVELPQLNLIGRVDGVAEDGRLVEHKTTSSEITDIYEYELQWDEQILAYMLMTGARSMWYTVCRKPTIRQKKGESDEEFYNRMVAWYDEETDKKIRLLLVERTDEEVQSFKRELKAISVEMNHAYNFYRNTQHCFKWGRQCEYAPICLHYDPNHTYVEFERVRE